MKQETIFFDTDERTLDLVAPTTPEDDTDDPDTVKLDAFAGFLLNHPDAFATIIGHTDTVNGAVEALIRDSDAAGGQGVTAKGPTVVEAENATAIDATTGSAAVSVSAGGSMLFGRGRGGRGLDQQGRHRGQRRGPELRAHRDGRRSRYRRDQRHVARRDGVRGGGVGDRLGQHLGRHRRRRRGHRQRQRGLLAGRLGRGRDRGEQDDQCRRGASRERHESVETTMIYTHVLNRGGLAVRSPADRPGLG
jgi:hypothetical protein